MTRTNQSKAATATAASAGATDATVSSKWTVTIDLGSLKRPMRPPTSENYHDWSLEQLKLECTARKLNVAKNTKKDDRANILEAWDTNKDGVESLLRHQRKRAKGESDEDKRTKGCMFRLLNVLFSDRFYEALLATGNQLSREEIDQGGSSFWTDVAAVFGSDTGEYNTLISNDAMFEGITASFKMVHSAAKLKRMWKEVSSNFAKAEAKSKVSGQCSHDFWDFCGGRADVYYLDQWCEHRQGGREFCSANLYPEDEDDSTKEGQGVTMQPVNRKRRRSSQSADILDRVNELLDSEAKETAAIQEDTWNEQKLLIKEQRAIQKLTTLYSMLDRNNTLTQDLLAKRQEFISKGIDASEIGEALANQHAKKQTLERHINELECEVIQGIQ